MVALWPFRQAVKKTWEDIEMKKALLWIGGAFAAVVLFNALMPKHPVELTLDASLQGSELVVQGTTSLPDGALISYEVTGRGKNTSNYPGVQGLDDSPGFVFEGTVPVKDGRYRGAVDFSHLPGQEAVEKIGVWVAFQTLLGASAKQPDAIVEEFGQMGEKLTGSNVTKAGALKRVELTATVAR